MRSSGRQHSSSASTHNTMSSRSKPKVTSKATLFLVLRVFAISNPFRMSSGAVFGVDLGSNTIKIGRAHRSGVDVILNESSNRLTP